MEWMQGYALYLIVGAVFGLFLSAVSFRYRKIPGRRFFWIFSTMVVFLILTTFLELVSLSFSLKLFWRNIEQIPLFFIGLTVYVFVLDYTGKPLGKMKKQLVLFAVPLILYVLLIATDPYHHLMRKSIGLSSVGRLSEIIVDPTLLNILFIAYNQVFTLYAILILAMHLQNTPKHYYKQHFLLLIGFLSPIVLVFLLPLLPYKILGFTAVTFLPAGVIVYYGLFRNQLLSIWPLAKDKIFINMKDGVVLTDRYDLIVDVNPAAVNVLSSINRDAPKTWINQHMLPYLQGHAALLAAYMNKTEVVLEFAVPGDAGVSYSASLIPIGSKHSRDTAMLMIFSDISDKKRYERELIQQATIDELTGLNNRRHFLKIVKEQQSQAGAGVSLMLLDIDNFKHINDTYGHIAGDVVLIQFADRLKQALSDLGTAGRVGGEEFAVLFCGLDQQQSLKEAERIREIIEAKTFVMQNEHYITVTASIGIAIQRKGIMSFEELYQQADTALYSSKRTGKNKVTLRD